MGVTKVVFLSLIGALLAITMKDVITRLRG